MVAPGGKGKWLTAIPLPYTEFPSWWERDAGLLCLGLRELGMDSEFVALGDPKARSPQPVILATLEQMKDEHWWRKQSAFGVIIHSRAAPRFEPIARAIKASGAKLVVHLDSDGFSSPYVSFRDYLFLTYVAFRDEGKRLASFMALAKSLLFRVLPQIYDLKVQRHLSHADLVTVNSPVGQERIRRLLLRFDRPDLAARLRHIAAPAGADCVYDAHIEKRRQIVAVGRWNSYQKDAPRLISTLDQVLQQLPGYRAVLIGVGGDVLRRLIQTRTGHTADRIVIPELVDRQTLVRFYQESQIIFVPSRAESLHLGAAEALCCGCSVVGAATVSSMQWFASRASGTLAPRRTVNDFADALLAEVQAWKKGERNAQAISDDWRSRILAKVSAQAILNEVEALGSFPPRERP
jgi:glycosyltransferase involved in cell wall biosynthesis